MAINLDKTAAAKKYYYSENGTTLGPFSLSLLLEKIDAETLVYREGIEWTNANEIEELKKFFKEKTAPIVSNNIGANFIPPAPIFSNVNSVKASNNKMFTAPFSFDGRIRRLEYGISIIVYYVVYLIVYGIASEVPLMGLAMIPIVWFLLAQGAKRCHDRGNSGWYQIIPFYIFWMLFAESDSGANEYGASPKFTN